MTIDLEKEREQAELIKALRKQIKDFIKQLKKIEKKVRKEVENVLAKAQKAVRISIAGVKDAIRSHLKEIPPLIEEAFTVDSPEKAGQMAQVYGKELAYALYDTQLRIEGLRHSILRAAAPLAQAVVPIVNTAVKALTVLANTVGKLVTAFAEGAFGIKVYEYNLKSALQTTASMERFLAGFDQLERIGSTGSGLSGFLIPQTEEVLPGWEKLAERIKQLLAPLKELDLSTAMEEAKKALKALEPAVQAVLDTVQWGWSSILLPLTQWAADNILPAYLQVLTAALETMAQVIRDIQPVLSWLWDNFFHKLALWYGQQLVADIQALGDKFRAFGDHVKEHLPTVQFLMDKLNGILGVVQALRTDTSLWDQIFKTVINALSAIGTGVSLLPGPLGVVLGLFGAMVSILQSLSGGFLGLETGAGQTIEAIRQMLTGLWDFTETEVVPPAEEGTKEFLNKVTGYFESSIQGISSAYNNMVAGMTETSFALADTPASVANAAMALRLKKLGFLQIPRLAKGAVLPANKPFMAMVGDQTHGTNVEAPLTTIQEALDLTLGERMEGMMAGFNAVTARQERILEAILGLDVSDAALAGAVKRYERRMALATGGL